MSLVTDNIKIKYSELGYLPNYPPHLISDKEMCDAFLYNDISYFYDTYPLNLFDFEGATDEELELNNELLKAYSGLVAVIKYYIDKFLDKDSDDWEDLPHWVYSYMLGHTVNKNSHHKDRHDLLVLLEYIYADVDNIEDELTPLSELACLEVSTRWINKVASKSNTYIDYVYEFPDGLQSIPISVVDDMCDNAWDGNITEGPEAAVPIPIEVIDKICAKFSDREHESEWDGVPTEGDVPELTEPIKLELIDMLANGEDISDIIQPHWRKASCRLRPPTIFGEPHVIKQLRLYDAAGLIYYDTRNVR